jgi:tetratricopeptide (TPR) repeat protein
MGKRSKRKKAAEPQSPAKVAGPDAVTSHNKSSPDYNWLWGLLLYLAVMVTYSPVYRAGFIWDDDLVVTANPVVAGPLGLKEIWTTFAADICPFTTTTFWLEYQLWGPASLPYHIVNVLLHGGCAILLWQVLRALRIPGAWLGSALWALHPVQVESVAWISEMKNTESCLFYLLTVLFFLRWLQAEPGDRKEKGWNYGLTLVFAASAMASKSSTVILPVVLCLCAWWMEGRWHWRNAAKVAPIFLMSLAAGLASIWTQGHRLEEATGAQWEWSRSGPARLAGAGDAVWFYLGKLLWPHPLMTIYPRWKTESGLVVSYLPLLGAILLLILLWLYRGGWSRPWFFAYAYFWVALLPVLGLISNTIFSFSLVFDHFQYLADMGPLALAGAGLAWLSDFIIPGRRWLQSILGTGIVALLGITSWQRAWVYESQETLWTDTLAKNPNCWLGDYNLGTTLAKKGQFGEAITQLQKAVELNPNFTKARTNLGLALLRAGRTSEAFAQVQAALKTDPNYAEAQNTMGGVLFQMGQIDEAIPYFERALGINPSYAEAHYNLGIIFAQKGQTDEAVTEFQKVLALTPNDAAARSHLNLEIAEKARTNGSALH